jgi:hypothetical protein
VRVTPPLAQRRTMPRAALLGLGLGALWGIAARVFMRLVSTEPSFSWSGTLGIIGLAAVFGVGVAMAAQARADGRSRWWWLVLLPGLLIFAGQGMPFLPGFLVGGLLLLRRNLLPRLLALVTIVGPGVALWWADRLDEVHMLPAPMRQQLGDLVALPLLILAMALAGHRLWGPRGQSSPGGRQSDSPERARSSRRSDSSLEAPAGPA